MRYPCLLAYRRYTASVCGRCGAGDRAVALVVLAMLRLFIDSFRLLLLLILHSPSGHSHRRLQLHARRSTARRLVVLVDDWGPLLHILVL